MNQEQLITTFRPILEAIAKAEAQDTRTQRNRRLRHIARDFKAARVPLPRIRSEYYLEMWRECAACNRAVRRARKAFARFERHVRLSDFVRVSYTPQLAEPGFKSYGAMTVS
jgi:hypothetical protein